MTPADHPAWMTAEETARYLRLPTTKALYEAVRRGSIPAHRLGRRLRFHRPELDAALLAQPGYLPR
jgi:excisionase family DNA binding protein